MKQEIKPEDLVINLWNSNEIKSKRGSWSWEKDYGVQIVHLPTGTVATCEEHRTQHKNKVGAMEKLKGMLKAT